MVCKIERIDLITVANVLHLIFWDWLNTEIDILVW